MLLTSCTRDAFLSVLQAVSGVVDRRQSMPILGNVLLRKKGSDIEFIATDLEMQIRARASLGVGDESGDITVSARRLVEVVRALPEGDIAISIDRAKLAIAAGKIRFLLNTIRADEFPVMSAVSYSNDFTVPASTLSRLLALTSFAGAANDVARPALSGILIEFDDGLMRSVATDGNRLAACSTALSCGASRLVRALLPRKVAGELHRLLPHEDCPVRIEVGDDGVRFTFGEIEMISKLLLHTFPDYQRVIPKGDGRPVVVDRLAALGALARVSVLSADKVRGVRVGATNNALKLAASNTYEEDAVEEVAVEGAAEVADTGFRIEYLRDVLSLASGDAVTIHFGGTTHEATRITSPDMPGFTYVVMPLRI